MCEDDGKRVLKIKKVADKKEKKKVLKIKGRLMDKNRDKRALKIVRKKREKKVNPQFESFEACKKEYRILNNKIKSMKVKYYFIIIQLIFSNIVTLIAMGIMIYFFTSHK